MHIFAPRVRGPNAVIFHQVSKTKYKKLKPPQLWFWEISGNSNFQHLYLCVAPCTSAWGSRTLKTFKKFTHWVVLTTQLLTRNQNFQNISADILDWMVSYTYISSFLNYKNYELTVKSSNTEPPNTMPPFFLPFLFEYL